MTAYSILPDQELIALLARDDNNAFQTLYDRHARALYLAAFKKLPVPHLLEDLLQEVFLNLYRKRSSLGTITNLRAYLHSALRNRILNELRNTLIHEQHHQQLIIPESTEAPCNYDLQLLEKRFGEALDRLTSRSREIFLLSRREELSYKEIADRLGISVKAVEKHMGKALQVMRSEFKDYGVMAVVCMAVAERWM
ncbi:sigma-70 family RNA polymerase sigma factor [Chitinophaga qingshengii]|uniref:Sigma-70 family RNA polymerase sigma factor n=1 Tax=Chitinophaga qingshengii TaxID=1569794 RepID=A0ABR7TM47_9BACT|nr:sigma-70 family RNA polymerase sigma factor [Chitinophaga qingshengii]MBC9931566.1 sigma-70 family RNA polymerase sigma factor [Chitinophaga qingshengii]